MTLTPIGASDVIGLTEPAPADPQETILSCSYAKWIFGKENVSCGPMTTSTGEFRCWNSNFIACKVTQMMSNGRPLHSWSGSGDFLWF